MGHVLKGEGGEEWRMMPLASRQANGLATGSSDIMSTRNQCSKLMLDALQGATDNASPICQEGM